MKKNWLTPEELEELRRFDGEIDNADLTLEDYEYSDFVDDLLFPEKRKARERRKESRTRATEASPEKVAEEAERMRRYYLEHQEEIADSHRRWYQKNKDRVRLQQREYRVRTGRQLTDEEKAKKAAEKAERDRAYQKAYREANREKYLAYQKAYREAKKKEKEAAKKTD